MMVFQLACDDAHSFEGWFRSSDDFARQMAEGMLQCPVCGSLSIEKAPMAPAVAAKGNQVSGGTRVDRQMSKGLVPKEVAEAFKALAAAQAKALSKSEWVGDRFAEEVRSMHYGESEEKQVHGSASGKEAAALIEEGISVAPLLVPIAPPDKLN
ncbi:DUF1178 family protein [Qipengyuania sp.]|uniref:DUF1178 family protein n=1 Tax=Qipengyuania sp. TaxID=2004515 RepID=UPI0035C7C499